MRALLTFFLALILIQSSFAQKALTWQEVRDKFEASNPTLQAGKLNIDESKAQEITAYLRPNPQFTQTADGTQIAPFQGTWRPFSGTDLSPSFSYLHERRHKRELRLESAQKATGIAVSTQADLERTLIFNLRAAFIQTLQQKAVLQLAKENLSYYDHLLDVNRERHKAGAIARVDLDRLELQRVTYESDVQTAEVSLRTAKIQLLALLNDRTPVEQFDVTGPFDFSAQLAPLDEIRQTALDTRFDLRAGMQSIDKAKTDHKLAVANGSTDPTLSSWYSYNPSFNNPFAHYTLGTSVSIPLRIFDRNQGEKQRTLLDIDRNQKLMEATRAQVFNDVDSAYATVSSTIARLQPYKERYLQQASRVRETIAFSYQHGAASLLDFLNAQADYRSVQVSYLNLVGSYLSAANQLNLAVGREVIP
ncbi:MAG TPA: TolC family protein [Candidatus Angelobacter sp.]|jgi:cobalt-zinc-cadmium efflux system outer membrane protein|nr:TolC family protein [Candidatus Angelobacter sp.]